MPADQMNINTKKDIYNGKKDWKKKYKFGNIGENV